MLAPPNALDYNYDTAERPNLAGHPRGEHQ
jgi:hypothetical protein